MSAGILRALMHLFAILGAGKTEESNLEVSRDIVAMFLRQQLNKELVQEYMGIYDSYIEKYQKKKKRANGKAAKRASLSSVKVLRICTQINEELAQKEKYFVVLRLLEFVTNFETTNSQDWDFLDVVYETFNMENEVFQNLKTLVELEEGMIVDHPDFLVITGDEDEVYGKSKKLASAGLKGKIIFVQIADENMFLFRYFGKTDLSLNGQSMIPDRSYLFLQGATIRGSRISPIYYSDVIHKYLDLVIEETIELRAENTSYYFSKNKQALHQFNIVEKSGNLIGIMGGSGSGKSTMLNVLNGNYTPTYGSVVINGVDIHKEPEKIKGTIGFVSQDDLLIQELSVYQNLYYNAKLSFGDKNEDELELLVINTLKSIGLFEVKDLKVGSPLIKTISGGQRKRLNIALELIREPAILFVDEPTSGLSSRDSENIMDLLKELTHKGKLIFTVIHQPSSDIFKMFDKLFILDMGGFPIYYGNPVESVVYFKKLVNHVNPSESECPKCGNVNPEQIFNIIESKIVDEYGRMTDYRKITPREWNNFFNVIIGNHIEKTKVKKVLPKSNFSIPSKIKQLGIFFKRDVLSKLSNKQYVLINLIEAPLLALILSFFIKFHTISSANVSKYIFSENENVTQYLFIAVIVMLFLGLTVSAEEIIKDRELLKREKFLNLSNGSYLTSKIVIMLSISAVQSLLFVLVGNYILEIKGLWFSYWIILFSTASFANLLGLNISASFNSAKVIYILIPILIIPQLLFSGVIVKFDKLNPVISSQTSVPWIGNIMASRWAFEALTVNQFKNNEFEKEYFDLEMQNSQLNWRKSYWASELQTIITKIKKDLHSGENTEELINNYKVFIHEITSEMKYSSNFVIDDLDKMSLSTLKADKLDEVSSVIDSYKKNLRKKYNAINNELDELKPSGKADSEENMRYMRMKEDYFNENLKDYVTNSDDMNKIVLYNNQIVQKIDPIYNMPVRKSFFGAHFLAPTKTLFGTQVDTVVANVYTIWGMILVLVFFLFFDVFKLLIDFLGLIPQKLKIKYRFLASVRDE